jgi:uncharacterized protein
MTGADDELIVSLLRERVPNLIAVYRFGSTVDRQTHPRSDVDVAVLARDILSPLDRFDLQECLAIRLGCDVDLVDLRRASTVMRMQVISTGRLLAAFEPGEQEAFEDLTFSAYARLNEERREILEQIRRDGRVHGR